jgi:hypothetical protein
MPPWHIDRSIGTYLDDPSLSDEEIGIVAKWADAGAPRGNPGDAPPPLLLSTLGEWRYGEPDLIVEMKQGFAIPAKGRDFFPEEVVDPGITEDRYVKWVQIIPTALCCTHHSHVYAMLPEGTEQDKRRVSPAMGTDTGAYVDLIEYAMGNDADYFPDGVGKKILAGSLFRFSAHYHPWGEETHDKQKIGIKFYPKGVVPEQVVTHHRLRTSLDDMWVLNREAVEDSLLRAGYPLKLDEARPPVGQWLNADDADSSGLFSIPPHTVARHDRYMPLPQPAMVISFQPHMHFRGSRMLLEAIHPDGRRETLTDVTHFQQNWQITYTYKEPHLFPTGTILHAVSWHDNTGNNPDNPDPSAWIGSGSRTMEEMAHAWTAISWLTEEQYQEKVATRDAQKARTNNEQ